MYQEELTCRENLKKGKGEKAQSKLRRIPSGGKEQLFLHRKKRGP
jgi:hypothetical protein